MDKQIFKYIEHELYHYRDTCKQIELLREEIMNPYNPSDENIGGSRSSGVSSPTEIKATRLMTDKKLRRLEEVKNAIEDVLYICDPVRRKLIELNYFKKPKLLSWDGVVEELPISKRTAFTYRNEIVQAIAEKLGY